MNDTIYNEQIVPDYRGNPLIEALPPIWSTGEVVDMLSQNGGHHDGECQLDAQYRLHCVHRLFRYFQPLEQHIDIEQRFSRCIRQGYLHRNPLYISQMGKEEEPDSQADDLRNSAGYNALKDNNSISSGEW